MAAKSVIPFLAALPLLSGCPTSRYLAYVFLGGHEKDVKAEFDKLAGKNVVVVIYSDKRVQYEHANVALTLSSAIAGELEKNVRKAKVVDPRRVVKYQDGNIYWDEMDKTELGRRFGADYVLFVSLVEFSTREPGSLNLYRGRINAEAGVYDVSLAERQARVWRAESLRVAHPEHTSTGVLRDSDRGIREATELLFAQELAKKFYDHKVPIE